MWLLILCTFCSTVIALDLQWGYFPSISEVVAGRGRQRRSRSDFSTGAGTAQKLWDFIQNFKKLFLI
jgi:hypothetical protein